MKTHILLIDDDIDEMKVFVEALKAVKSDFKITYASNGVHALKILLYLKPDVIFIDFNMPAMNGLQVVEQIRLIEALRGIPIFLYSVSMSKDTIERATGLEIAGCVEKPNTTRALTTMLKNIFSPITVQ